MKSVLKPLLLAGLLATAGIAAFSQAAPAGPMMGASAPMKHQGMRHHDRMGRMDPAKMQAWMDQRNAGLKAQLKITPAQESAWTAYTAAMKPPADLMASRPDRAALAKLPTPERIDTMKALRNRHMAEMSAAMDKRGEATKTLYAALTPEQQKAFDANATRRHGSDGRMGGPRHGRNAAPTPPASK
ncbi:Spy/CpxP family protein refolding chaperone [Rhodoferax ferrireducens]|uniref:Spy/CpxP family protein refolding chaperone n=1 Tax=Rhodoferax ferrireducens TaxID=192843 RepID=UPI000E0D58A7|nr:Spy/CpxP family protein refolding chaperone [Rhodoferax ferrireducens]